MRRFLILLLNLLFLTHLFGNEFNIEIYPKVNKNQTIKVLNLPYNADEREFLVQVTFGKWIEVDCNEHFFSNLKLNKKVLDGYGYEYYLLEGSDEVAKTLMACRDNVKNLEFVEFDPKLFLQYRSNFPFVFYMPKDFLIKLKFYRLEKTEIPKQ